MSKSTLRPSLEPYPVKFVARWEGSSVSTGIMVSISYTKLKGISQVVDCGVVW